MLNHLYNCARGVNTIHIVYRQSICTCNRLELAIHYSFVWGNPERSSGPSSHNILQYCFPHAHCLPRRLGRVDAGSRSLQHRHGRRTTAATPQPHLLDNAPRLRLLEDTPHPRQQLRHPHPERHLYPTKGRSGGTTYKPATKM